MSLWQRDWGTEVWVFDALGRTHLISLSLHTVCAKTHVFGKSSGVLEEPNPSCRRRIAALAFEKHNPAHSVSIYNSDLTILVGYVQNKRELENIYIMLYFLETFCSFIRSSSYTVQQLDGIVWVISFKPKWGKSIILSHLLCCFGTPTWVIIQCWAHNH